jgi:sphingosine kinase
MSSPKKGTDIGSGVLNALKGVPTPLDLFELTTPGAPNTRTITYMTQAVGLMADLDLGTEHLRWMGDARFMYGFVRGIVTHRACPVRLAIKVAENDKRAMVRTCEAARSAASPVACEGAKLGRPESTGGDFGEDLSDEEAAKLPDLKYDAKSTDGWIEVDQSPLFVYAGQGPYVGR